MKIEVNYVSPKHYAFHGTKVEVTLNECAPASMIPAYRIVKGDSKENIFRYRGLCWIEYPYMDLKQFIYDLHYALLRELPADKPIDDAWMSDWLKVGEKLFWRVAEPYYYLEPNRTSVNDMVKTSYAISGYVDTRRHFAPHERRLALGYAKMIRSMVCAPDLPEKEIFPEAIIEVLNPDGTAKTPLESRMFRCNHCGAVKFADEAILLDHLAGHHAEILEEAGYPDEATIEDVIHPNYTEVFWEEDVRSAEANSGANTQETAKRYQCKHCLQLLPADETALREHIKTKHPNVHENMQFPFMTTDAFICLNFYEVGDDDGSFGESSLKTYRCKHCGAIHGYDEEVLWGHLQLDHPELFEADQDLETPDMIECHWDDCSGEEVQ